MRITKEYSRNKPWKIALIVGIIVLAVAVIAGYIIIEQVDILTPVYSNRKYGYNIKSQLLKLLVIFPATSALAAWICTLF